MLEGPTAIAFIEADGDMVAVAKALVRLGARRRRSSRSAAASSTASPIGEDDVKNLATLPPVDVLRGQVLGAITAPLMTVVGLITAPVRDLIGLIDARIEQLQEQGDTESEAPAASAEAAAHEAEPRRPPKADAADRRARRRRVGCRGGSH